jgi:DNA invertase Pin-like site-specific DNA recombinase
MNRPLLVTASHLIRQALVYLRQSTPVQVKENQGSTEYQRDQARFPREWGWPEDLIQVIDEDLGQSGSSTLRRTGYRRMLEAVRAGLVGAIFTAEFSRIGRSLSDAVVLVNECKMRDVLIVVNGRVHDVRDSRDRLMATMVLNFAEFENDGRRESMYDGRLWKAKHGFAVSPPPVGYVKEPAKAITDRDHKLCGGKWIPDPDEKVRNAILTIFRAFLEQRSLVKTVAKLVEMGVEVPRRLGHLVYWVRPDIGKIGFMIRNRAYVGEYVFRKRRVDESLGRSPNGRLRDRPSTADEMVIVPDHHEPYVSRNQWNEMQHILDVNAPTKTRRNLGPGGAFLQGILRCAKHPTWVMRARNKQYQHGNTIYAYSCEGEVHIGGRRCGLVAAGPIQRMVLCEIAASLAPVTMEAAREAWRQIKAGAASEQRRHELELERLRQRVGDLRRRCMLVDPENRLVAAELESDWNAAKRELNRVEGQGPRPSLLDAFTDEAFDELTTLCADFDRLWNAPTTENRDRKEIVRTLLTDVIIEERTKEYLVGRIRWADGRPDTQITVRLGPWAHRRIAELAAEQLSPRLIAARLNDEGLRTLRGREWTRPTVEAALRSLRRRLGEAQLPGPRGR